MAVSADQQRVKTLLTETIILLCKNGLHFKDEFTVEGLIGITIDKNDVFLINIKETVSLNRPSVDNINVHLDSTPHMKRPLMKKRRFHSYGMQNINRNDSETASDIENPIKSNDLNSSASFKIGDNNCQSQLQHQILLQQQQQRQQQHCHKNNNINISSSNNNNNNQDNENPVDFSISLNTSKNSSFDSCRYQESLSINTSDSKSMDMHTPEMIKCDLENSLASHQNANYLNYDSAQNSSTNCAPHQQTNYHIDNDDDHEYKLAQFNDTSNNSDTNINNNNSSSNINDSILHNNINNDNSIISSHDNLSNVNSSINNKFINDNINIVNNINNNLCSKSIQNNSLLPECDSNNIFSLPTLKIKEEIHDIELNTLNNINNTLNDNINNNNNNLNNNNLNSMHNIHSSSANNTSDIPNSSSNNNCQSDSIPTQKSHRRPRHSKSRRYSLIDGSSMDPHNYQFFHEQAEQQVELLPGSGVFITMRAYAYLTKETWNRGSKLVRRVVREVFPDEHILARSSCLGKRLGGCHVGLDHHKVDTIKAFVQQRMPQVSHTEIVAAINECCRDIRAKLRKSYFRSTNSTSTLKQV